MGWRQQAILQYGLPESMVGKGRVRKTETRYPKECHSTYTKTYLYHLDDAERSAGVGHLWIYRNVSRNDPAGLRPSRAGLSGAGENGIRLMYIPVTSPDTICLNAQDAFARDGNLKVYTDRILGNSLRNAGVGCSSHPGGTIFSRAWRHPAIVWC